MTEQQLQTKLEAEHEEVMIQRARDRVGILKDTLKARFFERDDVIDGMAAAIVAREHVLIIGEPGTAKSELANAFCEALDGRFFSTLCTRFQPPEEVLGMLSLKGLQEDRYVRRTANRLPEADIAFLDEALALDTPIVKADGTWTTVGALCVGDVIVAPDGKGTKVLALTPVVDDGRCFRVTFADGAQIVADAGHNWSIRRENSESILTTQELADLVGSVTASGRRRKVSVPMTMPVEFAHVDLPIDPYVLGLWLGNGNRWNGELYIRSCWSDATIAEIRQRGFDASIRSTFKGTGCVAVSMGGTGFRGSLANLGLIESPTYSSKAVPPEYLQSSIAQRLDLLRGLMDTDGYIDAGGTCIFTNTNVAIIDAAAFIARSLGMRATKRLATAATENHAAVWRVTFRAHPSMNPFLVRDVSVPSIVQDGFVSIVSVDPCDSVPVRCLTVDHESHCFLAGEHLTVTHNCFKGSSALLNTLLRILNERSFEQDGVTQSIPLRLVVAASNELPDESDGLGAFHDRFLLRFDVRRLQSDENARAMIFRRRYFGGLPKVEHADLDRLSMAADAVVFTGDAEDAVLQVRTKLHDAGIRVSDRRWRKAAGLMRADAAIAGRDRATSANLGILEHCLWEKPDQVAKVREIVRAHVATWIKATREAHAALDEQTSRAQDAAAKGGRRAESVGQLAKVLDSLIDVDSSMDDLMKETPEASDEVDKVRARVVKIKALVMSGMRTHGIGV